MGQFSCRKGREVDTISELGELAFASRLKRLSERLMKDVSRVYKDLDVDFEARWFSILFALKKRSPLSITALAQSLRLTHPAVNQLAGEMIGRKLVLAAKSRQDERKRLLRLSAEGKRIAVVLAPVWNEIGAATKLLIESSGQDLLSGLEVVEKLLDEQDMYDRVTARLKRPPAARDASAPGGAVEIADFRPAWRKHFVSLNREWIEEFFAVEEADERVLADPKGVIVDRGGAILFARLDERIVGVCALIRHGANLFEMAKMVVAPEARRRRIGTELAHTTIKRARSLGANALYIQTSPKLIAANKLYRKLGFRNCSKSPFGGDAFRRQTFVMKLAPRQIDAIIRNRRSES